jgi:hypothetical protein
MTQSLHLWIPPLHFGSPFSTGSKAYVPPRSGKTLQGVTTHFTLFIKYVFNCV